MFCRSLCLFAYFDRKVSRFFYKYCISTRKSTSPLFEYCRCHSGFGPPADLDPRSKSASGYGPPFADLNPLPNVPFKHPLYHTWSLILFASFFVDVLFNHNKTFLSRGKKKTSHFVPILPHLLQRVVQYTQELDVNKLLNSNN